jgi:hypothetical protein
MRISETSTLFTEFLRVLNGALDAMTEEQRAQVTNRLDELVGGREAVAALYAGPEDEPVDHFTFQFSGGRFDLVGRGARAQGMDWNLPVSLMDKTIGDQERIYEQPDRFPWGWFLDSYQGPR